MRQMMENEDLLPEDILPDDLDDWAYWEDENNVLEFERDLEQKRQAEIDLKINWPKEKEKYFPFLP
jgi:hypothetical protein